jgi:uncharacterized membrane protein
MGFCGNCGTPLAEGAAFCGKCGTRLGTAPPPPPPPPPIPTANYQPPAYQAPVPASGSLSPNVAGALCYLVGFITGIVFLVLEPHKNDRFVRFHAFQSIFFSVAWFIFWFAVNNLFWMMGSLFLLGVGGLLLSLVGLAVFLLWLFLMYKAHSGERFKIPFIGDFAEKQAG